MSVFDSTSRINLSELNEDDLNLDLDDEDDLPKPNPTDTNNNKKNQFKIPEIPKPDLNDSILTGHQKNLETTLDDLFDGEDEEDFLIRAQPMFSSTQSTKSPTDANSPKSPSAEIIIGTQSAEELLKKIPILNQTISETSNDSDVNIWNQAQLDLGKQLSQIGLDENLLKKYTLDFYFKKVKILNK